MADGVEVSLEAFGDKRLAKVFPSEDVRHLSVEQLVELMIGQDWGPSNNRTLQAIERERSSSGGYRVSVGQGGGADQAVEFRPVTLGDKVSPYIMDQGLEEGQVRLSITGGHRVGYQG